MEGCKKQKMVNLVWRPISTQSSSIVAGYIASSLERFDRYELSRF